MHASAWVDLLRRIPAHYIDKLMVVTTNGTELSIQSLVRLNEEFLLIRARIAGSSDAGRAFFIPYDQINFLGFQKSIKEEELLALFDGPVAWAPPQAPPPSALDAVEALGSPEEEVPLEEPAPLAPSAAEPASGSAPGLPQDARALPTKSRVLANLRARLRSGG